MSLERSTGWWLRTDAAISGLLALPGIVDPGGVAAFFGVEDPTCTFLVRLWAGLLLLFGGLAWEAARSVAARTTLLKYLWTEKTIVAVTVLAGHLAGEVPPSLMGLVLVTHLLFVPPLLYADVVERRRTRPTAPAAGLAR